MSLEWHLVALFVAVLAILFPPLLVVSAVMWAITLSVAIRMSVRAPLPKGAPRWCRPLVAYLYALQPVLRGWSRWTHSLKHMRLPAPALRQAVSKGRSKHISAICRDLYWKSEDNVGREALLEQLVKAAPEAGFRGDFDNAWADWDIRLIGDRWHDLTIRTASEELGWPKRFTRARCRARMTYFGKWTLMVVGVWTLTALLSQELWAIGLGLAGLMLAGGFLWRSRRRCLRAVTALVARAGDRCQGLTPVIAESAAAKKVASSSKREPSEGSAEPPSGVRRPANDETSTMAR
jgi:hypothetical protein